MSDRHLTVIDEIHKFIEWPTQYPPELTSQIQRYFDQQKRIQEHLEKPTKPLIDPELMKQFQQVIIHHGKQVGKAFDNFSKSFHASFSAVDFDIPYLNRYMFGVEFQSAEELARQARREKFKEQREKCLHGKRTFPIRWSEEAAPQCPRCYSRSIYISEKTISCFLCGWSKPRVNGVGH
jgi:endonuclease III